MKQAFKEQNRIIKIIKKKINGLASKNFNILNYFALFDDLPGREILKFNLKKKSYIFFSILKSIYHLGYCSNFKFFYKKNVFQNKFKNIFITWSIKKNITKKNIFIDKYTNFDSKNKDTLWIIIIEENFSNFKLADNIVVLSLNKTKFDKIFFLKLLLINTFKLLLLRKNIFFNFNSYLGKFIFKFIHKNINILKIDNLYLPYEGQPFQKFLIHSMKKINKKLKCSGFDHNAPHSLPLQMYYNRTAPDILYVMGKETKRVYCKFFNWSKENVKFYFNMKKYQNLQKKINYILLPYNNYSQNEILFLIDQFDYYFKLKLEQIDFKNIFIKIHPEKINNLNHILFKKKLEKLIKKYSNKYLFKQHNQYFIFYVGHTTSIINHFDRNTKNIHFCLYPEFDLYNPFMWKGIKTKKISNFIYEYLMINQKHFLNKKLKKISFENMAM